LFPSLFLCAAERRFVPKAHIAHPLDTFQAGDNWKLAGKRINRS